MFGKITTIPLTYLSKQYFINKKTDANDTSAIYTKKQFIS